MNDATVETERLVFTDGRGRLVLSPPLEPPYCCLECFVSRLQPSGLEALGPVESSERLRGLMDSTSSLSRRHAWTLDADNRRACHLVLPQSTCARCVPADESYHLTAAVSDVVGLVRRVDSLGTSGEGVHLVAAEGIVARRSAAGSDFAAHGAGSAYDHAAAVAAAIAESLERYAATFVPPTITARASELAGDRAELPRGHLPGTSGDTCLRWVKGRRLGRESEAWVPAAAACLCYETAESEGDSHFNTSAGLAAARDIERAVRKAVYERIERDVFMRAWRLGLPAVSMTAAHDVVALALPNPWGAAVVAVFLEQSAPPLTATGLAADDSYEAAYDKAFREAVLARRVLERWLARGSRSVPLPPRTLLDHLRGHATDADLTKARRRWLASARAEALPVVCTYEQTLQLLPPAYAVELTTRDVAMFGVHVARVLIPGLVGLDEDARTPAVAGWPVPHPIG